MNNTGRTYSQYANSEARSELENLLAAKKNPEKYKVAMTLIGGHLGTVLAKKLPEISKCVIASTAEDADFLSKGIRESVSKKAKTFSAVFWNNHYRPNAGGSIAPIVHKYLQPGYESADTLIVVKSIISGSCVVRTNILSLIESLKVKHIYVVAPVMHANSEAALIDEFPEEISSKFQFVYFAKDSQKDNSGVIHPGIGGEIYNLLGMEDQPVKTNYMPALVRDLASI